jgi:hypothetical protein
MQKGDPIWTELKEFGAGWWINNINILKRTIEKVSNGNLYLTSYVNDLCLSSKHRLLFKNTCILI